VRCQPPSTAQTHNRNLSEPQFLKSIREDHLVLNCDPVRKPCSAGTDLPSSGSRLSVWAVAREELACSTKRKQQAQQERLWHEIIASGVPGKSWLPDASLQIKIPYPKPSSLDTIQDRHPQRPLRKRLLPAPAVCSLLLVSMLRVLQSVPLVTVFEIHRFPARCPRSDPWRARSGKADPATFQTSTYNMGGSLLSRVSGARIPQRPWRSSGNTL